MKIQFLGAAKEVTGSCYYIQTDQHKFLVDCGQFQGSQEEEKQNLEPFIFNPKTLDFVILTHGHIDHTGRLPKLVKEGFSGKVYMTRGTASLSEILLKDSGKIHEYENDKDNEKRSKAGLDPVQPYYTVDDAINTLMYFNPIDMNHTITVNDLSITLINAGHLLGSAHVLLEYKGIKYLFSGDIGTQHSQILIPPEPAVQADYIFMECTYGNKLHQDMQYRFDRLFAIIKETASQKGTVIIPAFSVGRTQDIIYGLRDFVDDDFNIPIYVDSPMAIHATKIFERDTEGMRPEVVKLIETGQSPFTLKTLKFIEDAKESHMLDQAFKDGSGPLNKPKVLISASGMCEAGRILYHLSTYLKKEKTNLIFVGYQAKESLGRKIQSNQAEVEIFNKTVKNNAGKYTLSGFSGHADQNELITWLSKTKPKKIILIHGEEGLEAMAKKIKEVYGYETYIPTLFETITLI